jgi:cytidylate kinase
MNAHSPLERAQPYLSAEWQDSRTPWKDSSRPTPFITISRESGSGGSSLARCIARRLNAEDPEGVPWRIFNGNLITRVLESNDLPAQFARYLPEDKVGEVDAVIGELVGLHPNLWDLVQKTNLVIRQLAREGRAIFVGRGANFATAALPYGVHVRLVAPAEDRARAMAVGHLSEEAARQQNERVDAARRKYVKMHFDADISNPAAYDLVVNTGRIRLEQAASLVISLVEARLPRSAATMSKRTA